MVQFWADELVPTMEHGIEKVLIHHRKTRHGVQTMEKHIPVLIPVKDRPGKSSQSKGRQRGLLDLECPKGSEVTIPTIDNALFHQCTDEQIYDHPDSDMKNDQSQSKACLCCHCLFIYNQKLTMDGDYHGAVAWTPE
jgi:hypothetical protein